MIGRRTDGLLLFAGSGQTVWLVRQVIRGLDSRVIMAQQVSVKSYLFLLKYAEI
jgi:hypothetical protein